MKRDGAGRKFAVENVLLIPPSVRVLTVLSADWAVVGLGSIMFLCNLCFSFFSFLQVGYLAMLLIGMCGRCLTVVRLLLLCRFLPRYCLMLTVILLLLKPLLMWLFYIVRTSLPLGCRVLHMVQPHLVYVFSLSVFVVFCLHVCIHVCLCGCLEFLKFFLRPWLVVLMLHGIVGSEGFFEIIILAERKVRSVFVFVFFLLLSVSIWFNCLLMLQFLPWSFHFPRNIYLSLRVVCFFLYVFFSDWLVFAASLVMISYSLTGVSPDRSYYGGPEFVCPTCGAFFWFLEGCRSYATAGGRSPVYTGCCRGGKVSLPAFPDWPHPLKALIRFDGGAVSAQFLRLIRHYNSMFCFTSLGARVDHSVNVGGGPYVFKMNGVVYHRIGSLLPSGGASPKYAQLYMVDSADEVRCRIDAFNREEGGSLAPDPEIVASLIAMLNRHHRLVQKFRIARANLCSPHAPRVAIRFMGDEGGDHGTRFSGPTASEVAALIIGEFAPECRRFDVVAETHSGFLQHVSSLNSNLMPLQYPLLFPYGDKGFHLGIKYINFSSNAEAGHPSSSRGAVTHLRGRSPRGQVSMMEYYCYYFHYRRGESNPYTCCGRLSQQIAVNSYSCVEANRLDFHFREQDDLRSETYQGISDAMGEGASTGENLGVQFILHSSFTGGRRYMLLNYHDGMAVCREYGAPDLFVTFTCNAKWQEIVDALVCEPGQTHVDRPDIVTRVFNMKFSEFLGDIKDGSAFGPIQACRFILLFFIT